MLDFSLSELAVVGTIALVVLGPERLPHAARTAGRWIGKARRFTTQMQQELTSQLDADELRKELSEHQRLLDEQMQETRQALAQVQRDTQQALTEQPSAEPTKAHMPLMHVPQDHYAQEETVAPWQPSSPVPAPLSPLQDAPRPVIAANALHTPGTPPHGGPTTTTRNADDS